MANKIFSIVKDTLLRLNLCLSRCRGQCYDGASTMAGSKNGLKTQILQEEPRALFTHCYGYLLNLTVADAIENLSFVQSNMDTTFEVSKLFQYSPKRLAMFQQLKADLSHTFVYFVARDGQFVMKHFVEFLRIMIHFCFCGMPF